MVQPIVEHSAASSSLFAEAEARRIPALCEPSEIEKVKYELAQVQFQPWRTSCVKCKAPSEPRNQIEGIIEDSELPTIQFDKVCVEKMWPLPME